jgi:2-oxoisovalerate ferredoxin oxidoreductase alpha subunit
LEAPVNDWAVQGNAETRGNLISSIHLHPAALEKHIRALERKYAAAEACCVDSESYMTEDAEIVLIGYGIVSRILHSAVDLARKAGIRLGLLRQHFTLAVSKRGASVPRPGSAVLPRL